MNKGLINILALIIFVLSPVVGDAVHYEAVLLPELSADVLAMSDNGTVVFKTWDGSSSSFLRKANGEIVTLPWGDIGQARVNDSGVVVGEVYDEELLGSWLMLYKHGSILNLHISLDLDPESHHLAPFGLTNSGLLAMEVFDYTEFQGSIILYDVLSERVVDTVFGYDISELSENGDMLYGNLQGYFYQASTRQSISLSDVFQRKHAISTHGVHITDTGIVVADTWSGEHHRHSYFNPYSGVLSHSDVMLYNSKMSPQGHIAGYLSNNGDVTVLFLDQSSQLVTPSGAEVIAYTRQGWVIGDSLAGRFVWTQDADLELMTNEMVPNLEELGFEVENLKISKVSKNGVIQAFDDGRDFLLFPAAD